MTTLADYSVPPANPASLRAAGIAGAMRYLDGPHALSRAEADSLAAAGLLIGSIYERGATDMLNPALWPGYGAAAAALAASAGQPTWAPIFFAADFDVAGSAQVDALLHSLGAAGAACHPYPAGIYGGLTACAAAAYVGCHWLWQTVAWSHGKIQAGIGILQTAQSEQVGGTTVDIDIDEGLIAEHGLWTPGAPQPCIDPATLGPDFWQGRFSPPPPGYTALPIIVQCKLIGERFVPAAA